VQDPCDEAFNTWLEEVSEDAGDSPLELAEAAFRAGWGAYMSRVLAAIGSSSSSRH
jgi:hypothetical protein